MTEQTSALIQMVIGLAGIVVTLLATPSFLDGIGKIRAGETLPKNFSGVGPPIRVFLIIFVMVAFAALTITGMIFTLAALAGQLAAVAPMMTATCITFGLLLLSAALTLLLYRKALGWFVATLGLTLLAGGAVGAVLGIGPALGGTLGFGAVFSIFALIPLAAE